jgi:tetratricopeptide (TPR) repeat protein
MHGRALVDKGDIDKALVYFRRAYEIGPDVDWLSNNLNSEYSNLAYKHLMNANLLMAEKIYLEMMNFNPLDIQAQNNYGVVLERMGETGKAEMQYLKTAERFPAAADPVFNLAVLSWKSGDWAKVVSYLEEVLRRKPDHAEAGKFLIQARQRLNKNG